MVSCWHAIKNVNHLGRFWYSEMLKSDKQKSAKKATFIA